MSPPEPTLPLTPIERAIDAATGYDPNAVQVVRVGVTMRCPGCGIEKNAPKRPEDPKRTKVVVFPCPKCEPASPGLLPVYLDKLGLELRPPWA